MVSEVELRERVAKGGLIETTAEMTPSYLGELQRMVVIAGDTEFMSAPFLLQYLDTDIPPRFLRQFLAILQDELGHAQIDYRVVEDLGVSHDSLIYERNINEFRHPYMFDMPIETWEEAALVEGMAEYAGAVLVTDIIDYSSYAPWRRALAKVLVEEKFHVRFGKAVLEDAVATVKGKRAVQKALDWQFPLYIEWFGAADTHKSHFIQTVYRLKGHGNDDMRQQWMAYTMPLLESLGLEAPAHYDKDKEEWVVDFPFPCHFEPDKKKWHFDRPVEWSEVFERWRRRGPKARENLAMLREGRRALRQLENA
jgi:ring-1,2-phenylacetyl-CoA epoxidase subunit PaaA